MSPSRAARADVSDGNPDVLPCTAPHCDRPAVAWVGRRHGDAIVLLVRLDFARMDHVTPLDYRIGSARCLDHAHDELDRAIEREPMQSRRERNGS